MTSTTSSAKKILAPLAVLLAAGALAVGSGATFTSASSNTISSVTAGTLTQSNSKAGQAIFELTDIKPGDVVNGSLTLTNTGTLPARFSLTETSSANGFSADNLNLTITNTTTGARVYDGTFGGLVDGAKQDLGAFGPGAANTYLFTVSLDAGTGNGDQGKTAGAIYTWDAVQLDATTTNQ
jgi:spore coat-associated protein N